MIVSFHEPTHTYTHIEKDRKYISVTTLIHNYVPEFDEDYWSLYKAVKDILSSHNRWKMYKTSVGGWENVVDVWRKNPLLNYQNEVIEHQLSYISKWKDERDTACEVGTAEHKLREEHFNSIDYYEHDNETYETPPKHNQDDILSIQDFDSNRIYTELLVYNDQYEVAGQVDRVRKKGRQVWIRDYKTSKEITKKAFRDETLLGPLTDLPNANWYIYNMQLSTYGWMLEQCGYTVMGLILEHTREKKLYEMPYLRDHVDRMMEDYVTF